jgi:putative Holliday junction resolvase
MLELMKRIGIDFGSKKIGIAMTDDAGKMAFPHEVVPNNKQFLKYVEELIRVRGIEEIVIGHSLDNQGKSNLIHSAVEEFITDITLATGIPVHLEPEQYTTQQAMRTQGRTEQTDAAAAALILDSFITKHQSK